MVCSRIDDISNVEAYHVAMQGFGSVVVLSRAGSPARKGSPSRSR
jgi:hypothetical protein